ncbi:DUF1679 domain-containing protein [Alteribacter keqinensis]|uniref:DUF1679 domain-containing protein n=1 Tax=Alteribacter keqinensis TaxID=2483800 RepID=A0A3M7TRM5_9BACI|nr:DUF1679 domain-containing protein [Alteribacter keqinensis]
MRFILHICLSHTLQEARWKWPSCQKGHWWKSKRLPLRNNSVTKLWDGEQIVGEGAAADLIAAQFPGFIPVTVRKLDQGFDNTVHLVNGTYVFRFPRRQVATALLDTEARLLPELPTFEGIDIARPEFFGKPSHGYPWPFLGYKHIPGKQAYDLSEKERAHSARPLGEFLKKLHNVDVKPEWKVPEDYLHRTDIHKRLPKLHSYIQDIKGTGETALYQKLTGYVETIDTNGLTDSYKPTLVHGDLHIKNVLIDPKENLLKGIIDWGDVHKGDPAVDLSFAYSFLPPEARPAFFHAYGDVSQAVKVKAQFVSLCISTLLYLYGCDYKDYNLSHAASQSVTRALVI